MDVAWLVIWDVHILTRFIQMRISAVQHARSYCIFGEEYCWDRIKNIVRRSTWNFLWFLSSFSWFQLVSSGDITCYYRLLSEFTFDILLFFYFIDRYSHSLIMTSFKIWVCSVMLHVSSSNFVFPFFVFFSHSIVGPLRLKYLLRKASNGKI